MRSLTLGIVALSALIGASGAAHALSEGGVSHADIAKAAAAVASIPDASERAQASNFLTEASGLVNEGNHQRAYRAVTKALDLAQTPQVAQNPN